VRIEIFIPDSSDPTYQSILEQLGNEMAYAYGGSSAVTTSGKYRSTEGLILPDKINLLFSDTPFVWERDRLVVEQYAERMRRVVHRTLAKEESILIVVYPVYHSE
jgi:hypothetical protein